MLSIAERQRRRDIENEKWKEKIKKIYEKAKNRNYKKDSLKVVKKELIEQITKSKNKKQIMWNLKFILSHYGYELLTEERYKRLDEGYMNFLTYPIHCANNQKKEEESINI